MSPHKKTAYLISCSNHYNHRLFVMDDYLRSRGYETIYLTSDFDHTSKTVFRCEVNGCIQLKAKPYKKNLSLDRILSHRRFARDAFRYLEKLPYTPDVVVVLLPPNSLSSYAAQYKKRHPKVKLIFDIFDLWPESFPSNRMKKLLAPVFALWAWIRDRSLSAADFVTTECALFHQRLGLQPDRSGVVYLCAKPLQIPRAEPKLAEDVLELCYLGAINNVVSISDICILLSQLSAMRPVKLHIIGAGEHQQELIDCAKASGADVVFYGAVYDDKRKQDIMSRCHFGLNIMKSSVCVGLTMKSVEYFRHGLPIINNIPADAEAFVQEKNVGIQLDENTAHKILAMTRQDALQMRNDVSDLLAQQFSYEVIFKRIGELLDDIFE